MTNKIINHGNVRLMADQVIAITCDENRFVKDYGFVHLFLKTGNVIKIESNNPKQDAFEWSVLVGFEEI